MMNNRKKGFGIVIITASLFAVVLLLGFSMLVNIGGIFTLSGGNASGADNYRIENLKAEPAEDNVKPNIKDALKPEVAEKEDKTPADSKKDDLTQLKSQLEDLYKNNGEWSVYIKDLKSGSELSVNNKKMVAASVIKLFIMAKVYEDIEEGKLEKTENLKGLLKRMITISHNDSSNKLVELLGKGNHEKGMALVNDYAKKINCSDTVQQRKFYDSGPPPNAKENYTSVEDCGRLLEKIYNKQCVSEEYSKEMLELLLAQARNNKLPSLLPKNVKVAHKTGELSRSEHDVGIVFVRKNDYIICVMSNDLKNSEQGRALVAKISKIVYEYFQSE
jgi:beta-lactamase class A